jgi:glycosyltransferase involved in cell wall biosynthesis
MKNENNSLPKVSVIIPVYNTSRFLERCIESVIEQSFTEIEIICVDDGSSDASPEILKRYAARDGRIKIVTHEKNMGLFAARITGVRESKGEYLCFVDSDDYISFDYLRALVTRAMRDDCDLVMASTVHTDATGAKWMHSQSARMKIEDRFGTDVLSGLLCQEGYCFLWHAVWNKLYKRRLFDLGLEFLSGVGEHIIMGEDILLSIVLHYYAESFSYTEYAHYFYFQHEGASTSSLSDAKRAQKYITDISTVFSLAEGFLREKGVGDVALSHFEKWRKLYSRFWCDNIRNSAISPREKARLLALLAESFSLDDIQPTRIGDGWFYSQSVPFDTRYLDLLSKIRKYDTVSFDLFDTLLTRPVLRPDDLFYFLDERYGKILGGSFHDIRCLAERRLRERTKGEVTLDGIYEEIKESLSLDAADVEEIERAEIELEDEYLTVRESVKNLLDFARSLDKEIIITSDFYMGESIISPILKKRGIYFDKLIISSDFGKTKAEGGLL